ncbi:MAG TPA: phosphoribosylamine--glycine ligase [Roseococcus sp.]|jgi:hypothetical protein|nr:phosphoribosylamine--glycine ligase [Roseococcus sp.]
MKPGVIFLAVLTLAACGSRATNTIGEPLTPDQAACRAEARRDPEVARIAAQVNSSTPEANALRLGEETRVAETRAWRRCLRTRGLTLPGGVEIIQPR